MRQSASMPNRSEAEDHLRVIRTLMERATIYRAVSAQGAAVGGAATLLGGLILAACFCAANHQGAQLNSDLPVRGVFTLVWGTVFLTASGANFYFLRRAALRRNDPFLSPGMRMALQALAPSLLCGAVLTTVALLLQQVWLGLPVVWMLCYGMGLLSTAHFAPRSISRLGWTFLNFGLLTAVCLALPGWSEYYWAMASNLLMMGAFGFGHLAYAAYVWPRQVAAPGAVAPTAEP